MQTGMPNNAVRYGFSYLELQVAFVLFGITLAGLGPLVVMQSRQLHQLESRFSEDTTYYLTPSSTPWARKLGAAACVTTDVPDPPASPPVTLIDNGDPGYVEEDLGSQDWHTVSRSSAYHGEFRRQNGWIGSDKAYWQFTGLEPGWYEVLVSYGPHDNQAKNAPFTVFDGTVAKDTVRVNQRKAPSGPVFDGSPWESLGLYSITGDTLQVRLTDDADGFIAADAVRIVPVRNELQVLSLQKSLATEEVTVRVTVDVQTP